MTMEYDNEHMQLFAYVEIIGFATALLEWVAKVQALEP